MRDFAFFNPTRIEFGKGKEDNIGQYVNEFGLSSVLILYGSDRIKRDGLFDRVSTSLQGQGVSFEELGGEVSNPKLSQVKEAIRIVKEKKLQAVVAVGGDSGLDSAKAIGAGAKYDGDVWDFFINKAVTPTQSRNPWGRRIWAQDNGRL
jgi:NADP-dependent alcohol dehydrogenase